MAKKYNQGVTVASTRFTKAPMGEIEYSRMYAEPSHTTTFNAGDIVPIYCNEVLPHDTFSVEVDEIIRQATLKVPSMDRAIIDIFAYFVPNRIVNKSWKNVMGENTSSSWTAPKVSLVPLYNGETSSVQIPVGSVADYYGFPTQKPIPASVLQSCNDLKFRGYLEIFNSYFRSQSYQPIIPYSKLNVYNGFLHPVGSFVGLNGGSGLEGRMSAGTVESPGVTSDGSFPYGAVGKELFGEGFRSENYDADFSISPRATAWSALTAPLKANKLHDYFTSVLPSPQKGEEVIIGLGEAAPIIVDTEMHDLGGALRFGATRSTSYANTPQSLYMSSSTAPTIGGDVLVDITDDAGSVVDGKWSQINHTNLSADLSQATGVSISDLRMSAAVQQVYEILGRGGSRYTEYINSFFGLDIDNPFDDIPTCLGHIRRDLDLYQTAQTSATTEDSPQGNLSAFGYTSTGGHLFERTFLEHGYIHILAVVRHKNIYSSLMTRDNFRMSLMDFYQYPLANISEQPVYTREINPYVRNSEQVFGYQEAWSEYRMEPDRVSGYIRPGIDLSLDFWSYADDFDDDIIFADGQFMESNSQAVIARGTSSNEENAPQFKGKFVFKITKQRPMPTYSMAGLDII